ncbi:hypothetical protein [Nevskia soli]|uniref:hypothetical protein n=1 Tax=Nevskia soli TaxID=418856 RepID=UPI0015D739F4|nr:hypothetical protein [Nevskia soli]
MYSITTPARTTPTYASHPAPLGTIFDEDVPVLTLVRYIFKVMFAFLIVNLILTLPFIAVVILFGLQVAGLHLPRL